MHVCSFGGVWFPGESISHAGWLYVHFCLSHHVVAELLFVCSQILPRDAETMPDAGGIMGAEVAA
jgi:hypothetical protein